MNSKWIPLCFWKECSDEYDQEVSIYDYLQKQPLQYDLELIIKYLNRGYCVAMCPKETFDVISGKSISLSFSIQSDGVYSWRSDLTYYLKNYLIALPEEFIQHVYRASSDFYFEPDYSGTNYYAIHECIKNLEEKNIDNECHRQKVSNILTNIRQKEMIFHKKELSFDMESELLTKWLIEYIRREAREEELHGSETEIMKLYKEVLDDIKLLTHTKWE